MSRGIEKFTGGILFGVGMSTAALAKDTARGRKMLGGFVSGVTRTLGSLTGQLSLVAGSAGMTALVKSSFAAIDALHDTSAAIGVTTEALSGLGYAAGQVGSSQTAIEKGLSKLAKSTADAATGVGTVSETYKMLGLNAKELNELSPDEQFRKVADAVSQLKNKQDQLVATQRIFGRGQSGLVNVLRLGSAGLAEQQKEGEGLGAVIKGIDAKRVADAADAFERMKVSIVGIGNVAATKLAPAIELAEMLASGGKTGDPISKIVRERKERAARHLQIQAQARFNQKQKQLDKNPGFNPQNFFSDPLGEMTRFQSANGHRAISQGGGMFGRMGGMLSGGLGAVGGALSPMSDMKKRGQAASGEAIGATVDLMRKLFPGIEGWGKNLMNFGEAALNIGGAGMNAANALRLQLDMDPRFRGPTQKKKSSMGSDGPTLAQAGSIEAHEQRVRGQNQSTKVWQEQLAVQKDIRKNTAKSQQIVIKPMGARA